MMMTCSTNQAVLFLRVLIGARLDRARSSEHGASAVEWVLISALLIGVALAVGAIILKKLTGKADGLNLG
jgi:Flp pilus assembly protein TadG